MVIASHVATEESRLALHRWIEASRRAGFSWADIGALIGISKQAAQQRFGGSEPVADPGSDPIVIRHRATSADEKVDARRGGPGRPGAGRYRQRRKLDLRQTGRRWDYERIAGLFPDSVRRQMERKGWTWVSTWYPFHYFKRDFGPLE